MRQEAAKREAELAAEAAAKRKQILLVRHLSLKSICRGMRFRKGCMGMLMKTLECSRTSGK